jgi:hypothetical protein
MRNINIKLFDGATFQGCPECGVYGLGLRFCPEDWVKFRVLPLAGGRTLAVPSAGLYGLGVVAAGANTFCPEHAVDIAGFPKPDKARQLY